jgi:hypothetical protein
MANVLQIAGLSAGLSLLGIALVATFVARYRSVSKDKEKIPLLGSVNDDD